VGDACSAGIRRYRQDFYTRVAIGELAFGLAATVKPGLPRKNREIFHLLNHPWFFWNAEKRGDFKI
jgi:hypothetical protein